MPMFDDVETILFCDETKFYTKAGDAEDAIFYLAVAVPKEIAARVTYEFDELIKKFHVKAPVFHATVIFKERLPREKLMEGIVALMVKYRLHCFISKYHALTQYEITKQLNYLNDNDIIAFDRQEFQALFWFLILLNTQLRDVRPDLLKRQLMLFFDRNVYGASDIEAFNFPGELFIIKQMTFVPKDKIRLLALPDFFGYLFRKSKISFNRAELGDRSLETSRLSIYAYKAIVDLAGAGLFHYLDVDKWIERVNKVSLAS